MAKQITYYVYYLIDPRDNAIFYVGKGCGKRVEHHERDARGLKFMNAAKESRIHEIWRAGLEVKRVIVQTFTSEDAAYAFEKSEIFRIGIENLTNLSHGSEGSTTKSIARGEQFIENMTNALPKWRGSKKSAAKELIEEMKENVSILKNFLRREENATDS